jgi:hypothetical protein
VTKTFFFFFADIGEKTRGSKGLTGASEGEKGRNETENAGEEMI